MKDIRVLCQQCINDYRDAGYKVYVINKQKDKCDKCGRLGIECELKESRKMHKKKIKTYALCLKKVL